MTEFIEIGGHPVRRIVSQSDCPLNKMVKECFSCDYTHKIGLCWHPIDVFNIILKTNRETEAKPHMTDEERQRNNEVWDRLYAEYFPPFEYTRHRYDKLKTQRIETIQSKSTKEHKA